MITDNREQSIAEIVSRLYAVHKQEQTEHIFNALLQTIGISSLILFLVSIIELFAHGNIEFRSILFIVWIVSSGLVLLYSLYLPISRLMFGNSSTISFDIAKRVGEYYEDIRDTLLNALQLTMLSFSQQGTSKELVIAAFDYAAEITREKDFSIIIKKEDKKASFLFMVLSLLVVGVLSFTVQPIGSALYRVLHYNESFIPPAPYSLSVSPINKNVLRGAKEYITITVTGKIPHQLYLFIKESQQEVFDKIPITTDTSHIYTYEITALKSSIEYYAQAEWLAEPVQSPLGSIQVIDRPAIRSMTGTVKPPSYCKQSSRTINEQSADILALKGTTVSLMVNSNKELSKASILILKQKKDYRDSATNNAKVYDTTRLSMNIASYIAKGSFSISSDAEYCVEIVDNDGRKNIDPIHYSITAISDNPPVITLIQPNGDVKITEQALLPISIQIADDYGFSSLKIYYRLVESRYSPPMEKYLSISIPFPSQAVSAEVDYLWDLNKLGIAPSDNYEFYCEVADNDNVTGPHYARTGIKSVRLPSLDEVLQQADSLQDNAIKELEKTAEDAREISKEMEELQREMLKQQQNMDWKDAKKVDNLLQKQEDLQKKVAEINNKLEELSDKLQENNAISPETMQQYQELQKLLKEVNSPEIRKAMEEMQKAMQQLNPEQIQQAMKTMKFNEEEFKKGLERTMNLLKRIQAEQKVDALTKRAEELAQKQDDLAKRSENANSQDSDNKKDLSMEQKALQEDLKKLAQELKDLESLMNDVKQQMPMNELDKAKEELSEEQTAKDMQEANEEMQNGQMNKSAQKQKKASQNVKKFAQQMKKLKQEMKKNMNKEAIRQMQKSLQNALSMSKQQESQKLKSQSLDYNSTQLPQSAQEQQKLQEQLANMAAEMMQLAQKSPAVSPEMVKEMSNAMQGMQKAAEQLSQRNPQMASQSQGQAMSALNKASIKMQDALNKLQGEGDGSCDNPGGQGEGKTGQGGFMQKLQQMAGTQQQINQGMPQPGSDGSLTPQQQQQLARLSAQQGKAQQAMQELAKEQQDPSGNKKALGDLQKIADEMREIVADMQSGSITPETRRRQEKILSRLLDASRSMNERDYETKRESRSGQDYSLKSPPPLNVQTQEGRNRALQDVLRSLGKGYTKDYEILIRQYFDRLQSSGQVKR